MAQNSQVDKAALHALFGQFLALHFGGAGNGGADGKVDVGVVDGPGVVDERGDVGSSVGSSMGFSWADDVEDGASQSSVELKGAPVISDAVKKLKIGGDEVDQVDGVGLKQVGGVLSGDGLMRQYVKTDAAKRLGSLLASCDVKLPKRARRDLALVTHSAATIPAFFGGGKARHRSLAAVGDAVLTLIAAHDAFARGMAVESAQFFRSTTLSDANIRRVFMGSEYQACVQFAAGVDPATGKAGATAMEAIFGVVYTYAGVDASRKLARQVGLIMVA